MFIETHSGKRYRLIEPTAEMICLEDIAHALSRICRFTGHVTDFYSVASHSIFVSALVPREYQLQALLHDATECYVGDVSSPLKHLLGDEYADLENAARWAICQHFLMDFELPPIVKQADRHALYLEAKHMFARRGCKTRQLPEYWKGFKQPGFPEMTPISFRIDIAEEIFTNAVTERLAWQPT